MYAIVRHYRTDAGSVRDMVRQVDAEFADRIPEQVGSLLYTAVDTGEGAAMTITLFADAESATRSEAMVTQVQRSLAERFGVDETTVHRGEVMVSRAAAAVAAPVRFAGTVS
ncbi:hypothetical protein [Nonomuraea sp. SYSU D8015]|uniref:hypothetical protein n=1 Tax=Nonomuraea sp. SYSU D8015 TaxID=2593644 RepID=UPI0016613E27|nr:hypothetical protein [Nonomuraea sp. SYSU D8015]